MSKRQAIVRILGGALALGLVMTIPAALQPSKVEATCGTAWTSKQEPPETIQVLRTASGRVEKVNFKRYVIDVMASGEWPTTMPIELLEAGAHVVKQYAWYYALEDNHRDDYRTASGQCYDVRDDARDQVYRPERAEPTKKQKAARDALWGLSLRKNGEFFLTGYRQGSATKCGADADSWHLYTRSAKDCVKRLDYDGEGVLRRYYKPNLNWEWAPGTEPSAKPEATPSAEPVDADSAEVESAETDGATVDEATGAVDSVLSWFQGLWESSE